MYAWILLQAFPSLLLTPGGQTEQHASLALHRAEEGRTLAQRFLCQKEERLTRLRELDLRFSEIQGRYSSIFNHEWQSDAGERIAEEARRRSDIGRKDDCRLRDSFSAGLIDYENGLLAAEAELERDL